MKRQFREGVVKEKWFQASDWQPYEPETPKTIEKTPKNPVVIEKEDGSQSEIPEKDETKKVSENANGDIQAELNKGISEQEEKQLRAAYKEKFGKEAHRNMKPENIRKKLNA